MKNNLQRNRVIDSINNADKVNPLLAPYFNQDAPTDEKPGIFIFGAGQGGQAFLTSLRNLEAVHPIHIKGFFDNDLSKHGISIDGVKIMPLVKDLIGLNDLVVIASLSYHNEIYHQLLNVGIEEQKIMHVSELSSEINQHSISGYEAQLQLIDSKILDIEPQGIPSLFREIPLEIFGQLSLQEQDRYKHIREFFPLMTSEEIQRRWTGSHGNALLSQSVAFIRTVMDFYQKQRVQDVDKSNLLDFGCGWGRLIRLLYKYIPVTQIYGADAWKISLDVCREHQVRGNFALVNDICKVIPFNVDFDLVISFSVFTHLSPRSGLAALNAIRQRIKNDGILALTVRPVEYWETHKQFIDSNISIDKLVQTHNTNGYAFIPHKLPPVDGDITFGDITISLDYVERNWRQWKLVEHTINAEDPCQRVLFFRPI